jgi:hypothetical protein
MDRSRRKTADGTLTSGVTSTASRKGKTQQTFRAFSRQKCNSVQPAFSAAMCWHAFSHSRRRSCSRCRGGGGAALAGASSGGARGSGLLLLPVTGPCFARVRRFRWRVFLVRQFPSSLSNNACGLRSSSVAPFGRCPLIFLSKYCTDVIRSARDLISKLNHLDTSRSPRCSLSIVSPNGFLSLSHPGRPILCVRHSTPANQPVHIPSSRLRTLTPN